LTTWMERDTDVLVLHDTPFPGQPIPECVAQNMNDLGECSGSRESWVPKDPLAKAAKSIDSENVSTADLTDKICTDDRCPAVVGGVIAYFDGSHISATFARTLAPYLAEPLTEAVRRSRAR